MFASKCPRDLDSILLQHAVLTCLNGVNRQKFCPLASQAEDLQLDSNVEWSLAFKLFGAVKTKTE